MALKANNSQLRALGKFTSYLSQGVLLWSASQYLDIENYQTLVLLLSLVIPICTLDFGIKSYIYALPESRSNQLIALSAIFVTLLISIIALSSPLSLLIVSWLPDIVIPSNHRNNGVNLLDLAVYFSLLRSLGEFLQAVMFQKNNHRAIALSDITLSITQLIAVLSMSCLGSLSLLTILGISTVPYLVFPFIFGYSTLKSLFTNTKAITLPIKQFVSTSSQFFMLQLSVLVPSYLMPVLILRNTSESVSVTLRILQITSTAISALFLGYFYHIMREASDTSSSPSLRLAIQQLVSPQKAFLLLILSITAGLISTSILVPASIYNLSGTLLLSTGNSLSLIFLIPSALISLFLNGLGKPYLSTIAYAASTLYIIVFINLSSSLSYLELSLFLPSSSLITLLVFISMIRKAKP